MNSFLQLTGHLYLAKNKALWYFFTFNNNNQVCGKKFVAQHEAAKRDS